MSSMTPPIRMVSVPVEDLERIEKKLRHGGWPSDAKMVRAMLTAAPVREEGGDWSAVRNVFVTYAGRFSQAARYEEASAIADIAAHDLAALATREGGQAEAGVLADAVERTKAHRERAHPNHKTMFINIADLDLILSALRAQPQARSGEGQ